MQMTDFLTRGPLHIGPVRLAAGVRRWLYPPLIGGLVGLVVVPPAGLALLGVAAFVAWFFRDPPRSPAGEGIIAPADGQVTVCREDDGRVRVGVFMSPFDVHVTRVPADGRVSRLDHRPGGHWPAFSKASERNERVEFTLDTQHGRIDGAMIAGTVARRAHAYHQQSANLTRGDRLGYIAFGSRTDLVLPEEFEREDLCVSLGQQVTAGETVLARRPE